MSEQCSILVFADDCLHLVGDCKCECNNEFRQPMNPWSFLCRNCGHITKARRL